MKVEPKISLALLHIITFSSVIMGCISSNRNIPTSSTATDNVQLVIQQTSVPDTNEEINNDAYQTSVPAPTYMLTTTTQAILNNYANTPKANSTHVFNMISTPVSVPKLINQDTLKTIREMPIPENNLREVAIRLLGNSNIPVTVQAKIDEHNIGDKITFSATNLDTDEHFDVIAELVYRGQEVYFFSRTDLDVRKNMMALKSLIDNFETNIIPNIRKFFGREWSPGIDGDPRLYILYTGGIGNSVGGYYSSTDEYSQLAHQYSNEKEMFYINADVINIDDAHIGSILAHEFQHMVHWANDANEETWVNEGASVLSEMINGYIPQVVDKAFAANPDIQLNSWSPSGGGTDSIPHYGASFLFLNYFLDRFGEEATSALIAHKDSGFTAMDQVLSAMNIVDGHTEKTITTIDVFSDWLIANYVGDTSWSDGRYGYHNYPDAPLATSSASMGCNSISGELTVHQYGADYIENDCTSRKKVVFTGSNQIGVANVQPYSGKFMFWGNRHDTSDTTLTKLVDLTTVSEATLNYWAWWSLENNYDYVYLLVSTDNGTTWQIIETPQGTDYNPSGNNLGWGYNNNSGKVKQPIWTQESVNISEFAGQQILLRFEYITDAAVNNPGFMLDDISIKEIDYKEDFEHGDGGWQSNGWVRFDNILPQSWLIQLVNKQTKEVTKIEIKDGTAEFEIEAGTTIVVAATTPYTTELPSYHIETHQ